jgi:hypothetical protein
MDDEDVEIQWAKIRKALIVAAIFTVLILLAVYGPAMWKMHSAQAVFNAYNQALVKKDYAAAYELLSPETRAAGSLNGLIQVQQALTDKHGEVRGFEEGAINTHLEDPHLISIHAVLICEKDKVPYVFLLKKKFLLWEIYGAIEE